MRADVVVVITNATVQDDKVPIVGGVDRIDTLGVDVDDRRIPRWHRRIRERQVVVAGAEDRLIGKAAGPGKWGAVRRHSFRVQSGVGIDRHAFIREFDTRHRGVLPRSGVELEGRIALVGHDIGHLVAALRIGREGPQQWIGITGFRTFRNRADVAENGPLGAEGAVERDVLVHLDFAGNRSDVLCRLLEIAIDEAVVGVTGNAELRHRAIAARIMPIRHAEIRQRAQLRVDVASGDLHGVGGRPLHRGERAPAVIGGQ